MFRKNVIALTGAITCASILLSLNASAQVTSRQYTPPYYVFSADTPHDLVTHDVGAIGLQAFVDILAWDDFIALNWPVPSPITQRGVPDRQNIIGGFVTSGGEGSKPRVSPTGPVVWETFKDVNDIFLNPPVKPTSFDTPEIIPAACQTLAAANPDAAVLSQSATVNDVLQNVKQAFTQQPLIDQNGEKVWYEVKVNRGYYDYVVNNEFYDSRKQSGQTISFPASSNVTNTEAAIKVKAAWKVMGLLGSKKPDNLASFYTTYALLFNPTTNSCEKRLVGLVGLHVVHKTQQLPQWMWATFEHVNNAPDVVNGGAVPVAGVQYNFFNPACKTCKLNTPPPSITSKRPTQVGRLIPVSSSAPNATYQAALKSLRADNVWQNYMLVDAQWGASPSPIGQPNQPAFLANTTMETYLQGAVVDKDAPHGCINCHGGFAASTDLDFQLTNAYPHSQNFHEIFEQVHGIGKKAAKK